VSAMRRTTSRTAAFCFLLLASSAATHAGAADVCTITAFAPQPAEGIVDVRTEPLLVREVAGILRSKAGPWPGEAIVRFELVPQGKSGPFQAIRADQQGRFAIRARPGRYCFRASAIGWQSIIGPIVVSPTAAPKPIELTLELGV
jgi:hypothetical protein